MDYAAIGLLLGAIISLVEERVGKFQELTPAKRQLINGFITYVLPLIVTFAATKIDPKYSAVDQAAIAGFVLLAAPMVCYAAGQAAHGIDKLIQARNSGQ